MLSFEIPDGPTAVVLKSQVVKGQNVRTGTAVFSVTNKSGQRLAGRVSVPAQGDTKADWFEIQGEKERNFAVAETQKVTINITVPANAPVGDYKFRFRVVNVNDPDNDYTDSAVATFNIAPAPVVKTDKKFPWWAVGVAAALVLIVGGVVAWLLIPVTPQLAIPDVRTKSFTEARQQLIAAGFKVPDMPVKGTPGGAQPNTVIAQNPPQGSAAKKDDTVTLTVDPGVIVPNVVGRLQTALGGDLKDFSVTFTMQRGVGTLNEIINTQPVPGTPLAKNAPLEVIFRGPPCIGRGCIEIFRVPAPDFLKIPNPAFEKGVAIPAPD